MSLNLSSLTILLVEDLQPMRDVLMAVLKAQGFGEIVPASNGERGYAEFVRCRPDIVITDWDMTGGDGLELTQMIRTSPTSPNPLVPIIMTTGYCSPEKIKLARDAGITEFLMKPFSAKDISKRVMHVIRKPRDFVVADCYSGPDRRRHSVEAPGISFIEQRGNTPRQAKKIVKPDLMLQKKVGLGDIPDDAVARSQKIIDDCRVNFLPIAQDFLYQFEGLVERLDAHGDHPSGRRVIESASIPVMQLKANSRVFKYNLLGDVAHILLTFMDGIQVLDKDALDVLVAHKKTMRHIITEDMAGTGGFIGDTFTDELRKLCERYRRTRMDMARAALQTMANA